ncbi:MAG: carboxypeptidase regulatory-like domain-containing protein [Myxococcota bacterium]
MRRLNLALALVVTALSCTPPGAKQGARARQIASKKDLIGGPHALGDFGDYLLENGDARFIIQGPGFSRGFGVYGGSLIDADIQRPLPPGEEDGPNGQDNFAEMFPAFFLVAMEPLPWATGEPAMEILPDQGDGSAAVIVRGYSNQFIFLTETINNTLVDPANLRFQNVYRLPANGRTIEVTTTVFNDGITDHKFQGVKFQDINLDIPFGDVLLFGAGNHVFAPGDGGFDLRYQLEERYKQPVALPALPGLITDFIASQGEHVSYGLFMPTAEPEKNFVAAHDALYGERAQPGRMLIPFIASAFTGVFHTQGPPKIEEESSFSFTRYFVVGNGDIASIASEVYRVRGTTTGELTGRVLDGLTLAEIEGSSVIVLDANGEPVSQATPRDGGNFTIPLPPGDYRVLVTAPGRDPTTPVKVTVTAGNKTFQEIKVTPPAILNVVINDENGAPLPAKVTLVASYATDQLGRDPKSHLFDLSIGEDWRTTDFIPDDDDPLTRRYIEDAFITHDGAVSAHVKPGTYDVFVSRGPEYDLSVTRVELLPGVVSDVRATLRRVVDTSGYVSADFHIHSVNSIDSSLAIEPRVVSYAAEGIEVMVSTDHNYVTDYAPTISELGLNSWMNSFIGLELTTLEMGHFNGYPLRYDTAPATHGSFEWSSRTPGQIFDALKGMGQLSPADTLVQVNHPRDSILGYFNQFVWDQETAVVEGQTDPVLGVNTLNYPNFAKENFSFQFDTLEVLNGKHFEYFHTYVVPDPLPPPPLPLPESGIAIPAPGQPMRDGEGKIAFPGVIDDWFKLLRLGVKPTGVANSDSHKALYDEAGYPRTYLRTGSDVPGRLDAQGLVSSLRSMDVLMTNGPFVTVQVQGGAMGSVVAPDSDGTVEVRGEVRTAPWVRPTTLTIFAGGRAVKTLEIPVDQRIFPFAERVVLPAGEDSFINVEVHGGDSLFPVVTPLDEPSLLFNDAIGAIAGSLGFGGNPYGNLRPALKFTVTPFALTNPVFVDVDGNGQYDAPEADALFQPVERPVPTVPWSRERPVMEGVEVQGPLRLQDLIRKPVRGQAADIRRVFQAFDHHH